MNSFPSSLQKLIRALQTLPEVGPKMAQRIAFHILMLEKPELEKLLSDVEQGYLHTMFCETCGNFSESSVCTFPSANCGNILMNRTAGNV